MKPTSRRSVPFRKEVRPLEDDKEIGHRWKSGNVWSLMILIGRGLDPTGIEKRPTESKKAQQGRVARCGSWMCSFEGARKRARRIPVTMAKGIHLFPYRTQKLSLSAPRVLGWRRPGRVGRCRKQERRDLARSGVFSFLCVVFDTILDDASRNLSLGALPAGGVGMAAASLRDCLSPPD